MAIIVAIGGFAIASVSIAEAKNQLPRIVQQVEAGSPVHIARHGKLVAVLLSQAEYSRLQARQANPKSLWETLQEWRKAHKPSDWPDLKDAEVGGWRDKSTPGEFTWDDWPIFWIATSSPSRRAQIRTPG